MLRLAICTFFIACLLQTGCATVERDRVKTAAALDHRCPDHSVVVLEKKTNIHFVLSVCGTKREYVYFSADRIVDVTDASVAERQDLADEESQRALKEYFETHRRVERLR